MNIELTIKAAGVDFSKQEQEKIMSVILKNFTTLWLGAKKLQRRKEELYTYEYNDGYTINIDNTIISDNRDYCKFDGHNLSNENFGPTENQLIKTVQQLQKLFDAAAEEVPCGVEIVIKEAKK